MNIKTKPLETFSMSFDDAVVNGEIFDFSFLTKFPSELINCFVNNSAAMLKKDEGEKVTLYLSKLKNGVRYRINCTYIDQKGEILWYGKMIKRVN